MPPLVSLEHVSLTFSRGAHHSVPVLVDVSLEIEPGQLMAVLAQRAQGKTTLLRVVAGVERPDRGHVVFDGEDLWRLSDRRRSSLLANEVALVEHGEPDLDLRVREIVALPLMRSYGRRRAYALANDVLTRIGIAACAGQRWGGLADFERALLTLARGMACAPRLLLIDDLMTTLGLGARDELGRLINDLASERRMTVLMSVSDTSCTVWCDRLVSLAGGEVLVPPADASDPDLRDAGLMAASLSQTLR